jgi:hypothetical protein
MFKDIRLSEDTTTEFKQNALGRGLHIDLSIKILTTGNWPNDNRETLQVILPREI